MAEVDAGAVAPVVPVTPAVQPAPTPDPTAGQEAVTPQGVEPEATPVPEKMLPQSEVNKLLAKEKAQAARRAEKSAMERFRAESAERELERLRAERATPEIAQGEPQPEQFKTPQEFVRALIKWERQQEAVATERDNDKQREVHSVKQEREYVDAKFADAVEKGFPDLQERLTAPDLPLSRPMADFVFEAEHGFAVGDYLADHKDEAKKIAQMHPVQQVLALNGIAAKLKTPPKPSAAPPPIVPNSGSGTPAKGYRPDMSDKEYADWRKRQIAQRAN